MLLTIQISIIIFAIILFIMLARVGKMNFKMDISVIIIYIVTVLILMILLNNNYYIKEIIDNSLIKFLDEFILFTISTGIAVTIDTVIVAILQKNKEKKIIKKHESKYKISEIPYYRDIINEIPPAMLSYIYDLKLNYNDQIISTIFNLKLKGIIEIKDDEVIIIGDIEQLNQHEKVILEYITGKITKKSIKKILKENIIKDLIKLKLIYAKDSEEFNVTMFMELIMCWMIIFTICTISIIFPISKISPFMMISYCLIFASIPIYKAISSSICPFIRTKEALKLSAKLSGLKNYLSEFTLIKDKDIEEIKLYEEYILYALIVDIKGDLRDDGIKIYKRIIEKLDNKM